MRGQGQTDERHRHHPYYAPSIIFSVSCPPRELQRFSTRRLQEERERGICRIRYITLTHKILRRASPCNFCTYKDSSLWNKKTSSGADILPIKTVHSGTSINTIRNVNCRSPNKVQGHGGPCPQGTHDGRGNYRSSPEGWRSSTQSDCERFVSYRHLHSRRA